MESYIEIFKKMKKTKFKNLREWQGYCLSLYSKIEGKSRIVGIKAPTGTGKTLIGLIIASKAIYDKKSALYITWTDSFIEKVKDTAQQLGISLVSFGGKGGTPNENDKRARNILAYRRKQAIGITNFATFLKSKIPYPDILIIDDADLFLEALINFFTIKIPRRIAPILFNEILEKLDSNVYENLDELRNIKGYSDKQLLIYFSEHLDVINLIRQQMENIINQDLITGDSQDQNIRDLFYDWLRNKERLHGNLIYLEHKYIFLQPYLPPSNSIENFATSERIVLMSATLGNQRRFAWELGLPIEEISIIDEEILISEGTPPNKIHMGVRAIFPITDIDIKDINSIISAIIKICEQFDKILVLCISRSERDSLKNMLPLYTDLNDFKIISYSDQKDIVDFMNSSKSLLIVGGQYFGLDIPDNVCNCAIITQIPYISDPRDKLEANILGNQEYHYERTARRVTQALGRINRNFGDLSVFFIFDKRYYDELATGLTWSKFLPPMIIAETLFTIEQTRNNTLQEALKISKHFLQKKYVNFLQKREKLIQEAVELVKKVDSGYYSGFFNEIEAWNLFYQEAYDDAANEFRKCADLIHNNTQNYQDQSVQNRKAFNLYLAAKALYILHHRGGDESYFEDCQNLIRRAKASSLIPWFQRLERLNIYPIIEIEKIPEGVETATFDNLEEFFTSVIWNHPSFTDDLKIQYKKAFSAIKIGATEAAGERVHTLIERVFRSIVEYLDLDLPDNMNELDKLSISQILHILRINNVCRKTTLNYWYEETESPGHLRSRIVHQNYDTKSIQEFQEVVYWLKRGLKAIFQDIRTFSFMDKNLSTDVLNSLNDLGREYRRLSNNEKFTEILSKWANEKLKLESVTEEDGSLVSAKCTVEHKGKSVILILG